MDKPEYQRGAAKRIAEVKTAMLRSIAMEGKREELAVQDERRVTVVGKHVLLDGEHLALARSPEAAFVIAWCLSAARSSDHMPSYHVADADEKRVQEFFA